jgi:hypothetical protein
MKLKEIKCFVDCTWNKDSECTIKKPIELHECSNGGFLHVHCEHHMTCEEFWDEKRLESEHNVNDYES